MTKGTKWTNYQIIEQIEYYLIHYKFSRTFPIKSIQKRYVCIFIQWKKAQLNLQMEKNTSMWKQTPSVKAKNLLWSSSMATPQAPFLGLNIWSTLKIGKDTWSPWTSEEWANLPTRTLRPDTHIGLKIWKIFARSRESRNVRLLDGVSEVEFQWS